MKKTFLGISLVLLVLLISFSFYFSRSAGYLIKKEINHFIAKIPDTSFQSEKISFAFPFGINIHNVLFKYEKSQVTVKKVTLNVNLIKLIKTQNPLTSISETSLYEAEIILKKIPSMPGFKAPGLPLSSHRFIWRNLKVITGNLTFTSDSGEIYSDTRMLSVNANLEINPLTARVKFYSDFSEKNWRLDLFSQLQKSKVTSNVELKGAYDKDFFESAGNVVLQAKTSDFVLTGSGNFKITGISAPPEITIDIPDVSYNFTKNVYKGKLKITLNENKFSLEELSISSATQSLFAKGSIQDNNLSFSSTIRSLELNNFVKGLTGKINSRITISGTFKNPDFISKTTFEKIEIIPLDFSIHKGEMFLSSKNNKILFNLKSAEQVILVEATLQGIKKPPEAYGNFQIKGKSDLTGTFSLQKDEFRLANVRSHYEGKESLFFNAAFKKQNKDRGFYKLVAKLKQFNVSKKIYVTGDFEMTGNTFQKDEFSADGILKGRNIQINGTPQSDLKMQVSITKNILNSEISLGRTLSGEIKMDLNDKTASFKLSGEKLSYRKGVLSFRTKGKYYSGKIKLDGDLIVAEKEKGTFSADFENPGQPVINAVISIPYLSVKTLNGFLSQNNDFKLPVSGIVNLGVNIAGKLDNPSISFTAQSTDLMSYDGKILPENWSGFILAGNLSGQMKRLSIDKCEILSEEQKIELLKGSFFNFSDKDKVSLSVDVKVSNLNVGIIKAFGTLKASGSMLKNGTYAEINLLTQNFWLNNLGTQETSLFMIYENIKSRSEQKITFNPLDAEKIQVSGKIRISSSGEFSFDNLFINQRTDRDNLKRSFKIDGSVSSKQIDVISTGSGIALDSIASFFNLDVPLTGESDFTLILKGALKNPYASGTFNISSGEIYSLPFTNANMQVIYENSVLKVTNVRIIQSDRLSKKEILLITGYANFPILISKNLPKPGQSRIDALLKIEKGDLGSFKGVAGFIKSASGKLDAKIKVTGQIDEPVYEGYFIITGGEIHSTKYFDKITRFNAGLTLSKDRLEIKDISGKIGEGEFRLTGFVRLGEFFKIIEYKVIFETTSRRGLKIYIPELPMPVGGELLKNARIEELIGNHSFGEPHACIEFSQKDNSTMMSGFIRLDNTHFCYPPPESAPSSGIFTQSKMLVDLEIKSGENTWFESDTISANIDGSVRMSGSFPKPLVNGKIESTRGSINYINKVYEIKEVIFEVIDSECYLEGRAETTGIFLTSRDSISSRLTPADQTTAQDRSGVPSTVILVIPRSPVGKIVPNFVSKDHPELTSEKIIMGSYGLSDTMSANERELWLRQQLVRLFDSSLASPLAKSLLQKSGLIDSVRVTYDTRFAGRQSAEGSASGISLIDALTGTRYVLEKYITGDLLLGYAITLGELRQRLDLRHEFELAYRWRGNLFVRGSYARAPQRLERDEWLIKLEPRWRFGWDDENKKGKEVAGETFQR